MNTQVQQTATSALSGQHLTISYKGHTVINDLSLTLNAGEICVLLGANGCGKSTLLKTLAGALTPVSGNVQLQNQPLANYNARQRARQLAFLPQNPNAPDSLTVRELILLGRYPFRHPLLPAGKDDKAIVEDVLTQMSLEELAERKLGTLSGGQQQRAWLGMALAQQSDILMLDEPTSFLDLAHQYELMQLIRQQNRQQGTTIIMVLHDLNQAFEFADRLIFLRQGSIVADGSPQQTASSELIREVFGLDTLVMPHPQQPHPICLPVSEPD